MSIHTTLIENEGEKGFEDFKPETYQINIELNGLNKKIIKDSLRTFY